MFVFRFIYPAEHFPRHYIRQAFFARREQTPMRSTVSLSDDIGSTAVLKLTVDWDEPGTIHIPWFTKRFGLAFYSTEVLRPRSEPFYLIRELVRGQMSRITKREFHLERIGLSFTDSLRKSIQAARSKTVRFLTMAPETPGFDDAGIAVFEYLIQVSHLLLDQYLDQALYTRKVNSASYPVLFGSRSFRFQQFEHFKEQFSEFAHTFQFWNPGMTWAHIEPEPGQYRWDYLDEFVTAAQKNHLEPVFGPIVRWDRKSLPQWLAQSIDEPYTIRQHLFRYADQLICRYSSAVSKWVIASGIGNEMEHILVQKRIEWADAMARTILSQNRDAATLIAFERPWGDSLRYHSEIPPIELAEVFREKQSCHGFLIGLDFGLSADATLPRDPFELSLLIDKWGKIGKPLIFSFSIPSAPAPCDPHWVTAAGKSYPIWNLQTQQENAALSFLAFLTRKAVHGIFWNRFEDIPEEDLPPAKPEWKGNAEEDTKSFVELCGDDETKVSGEIAASSENSEESAASGEDNLLLNLSSDEEAEILEPEDMEIASLEDGLTPVALSFPHSGLISTEGEPKPAFRKLYALKNAYLGFNYPE